MTGRTIEAIWSEYDRMEARLSAPLSARMIALADLRPGQRVLDLATGRGEPAIPAARAVGTDGRVVGVDPQASMLAMARARAEEEGLTNLALFTADAETLLGVPEGPFDAVLARWGLMFMRDPVAALRAASARLVDGGAFVAAMWGPPAQVSWHTLPRAALAPYRALPTDDPAGPSVFHYASPDVIARDFEAAGLRLDATEEQHVDVLETSEEATLIAWCRSFGMNKLLDGLPAETQCAWERDLIGATKALSSDGLLRLGGTTLLVRARPRSPAR